MSGTPPNWYPDPSDPTLLRYWDGNAWTGHTHPAVPGTSSAPTDLHENQQEFRTDSHGDEILFQERTHGSAKSDVTITANRMTVAKRSIAFADVTGYLHDVTQLLAFGVKSGTSYTLVLKGDGIKTTGFTTQGLPLRAQRNEAEPQFLRALALLETHLVPVLLQTLYTRVMNNQPVDIPGAELSSEGIRMKKKFVRWDEYCGTTEDGRVVSILGPTPDTILGTTFVSFVNVRLLAQLCALCARSVRGLRRVS